MTSPLKRLEPSQFHKNVRTEKRGSVFCKVKHK
jgi:hypothetical protein